MTWHTHPPGASDSWLSRAPQLCDPLAHKDPGPTKAWARLHPNAPEKGCLKLGLHSPQGAHVSQKPLLSDYKAAAQ